MRNFLTLVISTAIALTFSCAQSDDKKQEKESPKNSQDAQRSEAPSTDIHEDEFLGFLLTENASSEDTNDEKDSSSNEHDDLAEEKKAKRHEKLKESTAKIIEILDTDGDQSLNAVELEPLLKISLRFARHKSHVLEKKLLGKQKSESENKDEKSEKDKSHAHAVAMKCLDVNKDGKLSLEEIKAKDKADECLRSYNASGH